MIRRSRRTLLHGIVFLSALFLIVYLGRSPDSYDNDTGHPSSSQSHSQSSSPSLYAWGRVQYKTSAKNLPSSNGVCPGLDGSGISGAEKPALVVSHVSADGSTDWLLSLREKYHICIYESDQTPATPSSHLQVPRNRGHETMAYLTFLIDNYSHIPPSGAVFIHGSRLAWHNDATDWDNQPLLSSLNLSAALEPHGYHNLRCDWSASTCDPSTPPQAGFEVQFNAKLGPRSGRWQSDAALPAALATLFGGDADTQKLHRTLLSRSDVLRSQCCAQFAVSRARIHQHSRAEYVALRQWLLDSEAAGGAPADDRVAGRILSYVWHILFLGPSRNDEGEGGISEGSGLVDLHQLNRRACPSAAECYCRLYGRCDLQGCAEGRCPGQYHIPPGYRVPRVDAAE